MAIMIIVFFLIPEREVHPEGLEARNRCGLVREFKSGAFPVKDIVQSEAPRLLIFQEIS